MYCHDCGTANTVDSKYCKECGTRINDGHRTMMLTVNDLPVGQPEAVVERLTRLLDMAFWHNQAGNVDAAIAAGESALAINPNSTTAHSLLGTLYEKKGEDAQAILHFESVLALNPDSAADEAKLDQLRRGVHVKAVLPPAVHLWLPPAMVKLAPKIGERWQTVSGGRPMPRKPLMAAGAAGIAVLTLGLLLFRPWATAEAQVTPAMAPPMIQAPPVAVDRSAFAGSRPSSISSMPKPVVMMPAPAGGASTYSAPALTGHDPFAGVAPSAPSAPRVAAAPAWSLPAVPPRRVASARRRNAGFRLPTLPLDLSAIPAPGASELAPAPVTVPSSLTPLATVAAIPQHTVMVSSLPGPASPVSADSVADLPSHIRITVHQVKADDAAAAPVASRNGSGETSAKAELYQQRALALQQQGDYRQARLAYQGAIRAYQTQIESGHDVETAQRGLAACQTGLQICQQSQ